MGVRRLGREHGGRGGGAIPFQRDRENLAWPVDGVRVGREHGKRTDRDTVPPCKPKTRAGGQAVEV